MDKVKENLMKEFDFEKVAKVMEFVGWKLYNNGKMDFPTVEHLRNTVSRLYDELVSEDILSNSTAGFRVYYDNEFDSKESIRIDFVLESKLEFLKEE